MTALTAFILGVVAALSLFLIVPCLIGLSIRYLAQEELDPTDDAAPTDACWGLWAEIVCPECGKHMGGPVTDAQHHPTRIYDLCLACQRAAHPSLPARPGLPSDYTHN